MAYPYRADEWADLAAAQREIEGLVAAIAETERVELLTPDGSLPPALAFLAPQVRAHALPYGDAWTRDTGPIWSLRDGQPVALCFRFDGWGGKYPMEGDPLVAGAIADTLSLSQVRHDFVLEGGAVEFDGEGTLLTTPCLRLSNRKPPADLHMRMKSAFGVSCLLEIEGQLRNDHTDGHIDTLVRFVRPGEVVCMRGEVDDPNGAMLLHIEEQLLAMTDAQGRRLRVHTIPAPGAVRDEEGTLLAASYCNYYLANGQVLVPTYGTAADEAAVDALASLFPDRRVRGLPARAIVAGGGAFHCITQQQPAFVRA